MRTNVRKVERRGISNLLTVPTLAKDIRASLQAVPLLLSPLSSCSTTATSTTLSSASGLVVIPAVLALTVSFKDVHPSHKEAHPSPTLFTDVPCELLAYHLGLLGFLVRAWNILLYFMGLQVAKTFFLSGECTHA